eukprot:TCALIF_02094-PA protein Name:"Similar to ABHD16A Abhydrolase domain-containing protein 16A (Bos taurus)" AED:0.10 eAED:0.10 QI:561/1/0.87/1/0.57/0.5/8/0/382
MRATQNFDVHAKTALRRFDFEFSAWPVEFDAATLPFAKSIATPSPSQAFNSFTYWPHKASAWILINTLGLKLIYPGSTRWFLQPMVGQSLTQQRGVLVGKQGGERFKLRTRDANHIDSMFFDRRPLQGNGQFLVIVCEGNAGFYEIGMSSTALDASYSVLGWNHPGFWGSTGSPLPNQTLNAADTVFQFAVNRLGFPVENIIVFGWSIGGFPASWLAQAYPQIKAVILDATFDHVTPLAVPKMPAMAENVVRVAINEFVNLDVAQLAERFHGPIRLIRRCRDEMIATDDTQPNKTNRINFLLLRILASRYPALFETEESGQTLLQYLGVEHVDQDRRPPLASIDDSQLRVSTFPSELGKGLTQSEKNKIILVLVRSLRIKGL